jgi:hypothetical protein
VRSAGDDGADLDPYAPLVGPGDHAAVERAATLLVLSDDIEERCRDDGRLAVRVRTRPREARIVVQGLAGWRPRRIESRFARSFGRRLLVLPGR